MTEIGFYHLTRSRLEEALPRLLEKAYAARARVIVRTSGAERLEALSRALWTYRKESFLPHGSRADGEAERQPIYLTTGEENPNGATFLFLTDGAQAGDLASFARCFDLFDGGDAEAVERARERWRAALAEGHRCVYWQQSEAGGWTQAAARQG